MTTKEKFDLISKVMRELIELNGQTTTLEVKNECHAQDSSCGLAQSEVSATMNDIFKSSNEFARKNVVTNGNTHFEYSLDSNAIKGSASAPVVNTAVGLLSGITNSGLDKYIAFEKQNLGSALLFDTTDRFAARKAFKARTGIKHEDVRMITVKTYLARTQKS